MVVNFGYPNVENTPSDLQSPLPSPLQSQLQRIRILASDVSLTLTPHTDSSILNVLSGTIVEITDDLNPATSLVRLKVGGSYLLARLTKKSLHKLGSDLG